MLGLITTTLGFVLGLILLFSKRYSNLRFMQLYLFGSTAIWIVYKVFFPANWQFYLYFLAIGEAFLFALAYWDIARVQEKKSFHILLAAAALILFVPVFPVPNIAKPVLPFFIVDLIIACTLPFAFKRRNPFLIIWGVATSFAIALDILELTVPTIYESLLLGTIGVFTPALGYASFIAVIAWDPLKAWMKKQIEENYPKDSMQFAHAQENGAPNLTVVDFPDSTDVIADDPDIEIEKNFVLDPMLESAAKMLTISKKPYLTPEEAIFYLGMNDIDELEEFIDRFKIQTLRLSTKQSTWVVRREALENID